VSPDGDGRDWLTTSLRAVGWWMVTTPFVLAALVAVLVTMAVVRRRR
jgi:hypothetical protein